MPRKHSTIDQTTLMPAQGAPRWRLMIKPDLQAVLDIEAASFDDPWRKDDFLAHLRQVDHFGLVVEIGEQIVGFLVYQFDEHRLMLVNMAVTPTHRRRGIATLMIARLKSKLTGRRKSITLAVCERNLGAQNFFKRHGFAATEIIRGDPDEYVMEFRLDLGGGHESS